MLMSIFILSFKIAIFHITLFLDYCQKGKYYK